MVNTKLNPENLKEYEFIEQKYIEDLDCYSSLLKHKKSGARVAILENDDENKVFYIGFRTPPKDSTGVAHILEHSVLCGSEKYPSKDPFVELAKGSLNTFLNAMTYPDKTVYPVASCNDKDFKNLMDVYLDAVFHPNIYNEKKIFLQEGWHYELDDITNELKINGVVYNEMKGAFSSPDDVLARQIMNSLYPDTAYGVESGGDPEDIPNLTYENFLDFHRAYYHPVNSYIYLYGNADMNERLKYLDSEYLSKYDAISIESFPGKQEPFKETKYVVKEYPITDNEEVKNNTYLSYNCVIEDNLDPELYIAFQLIDYALVDSQGTILRKALLDAGIGNDIFSQYENGIYQPYYSIVAKNANEEDREEFLRIVRECLIKVSEEGFDKNALEAGLNSFEFRYRESDFGSMPRGLVIGLGAFDSWLYDDMQPFMHVVCNQSFKNIREKIKTDYFENLVKKYLIGNPHSSVVTVKPVKGLGAKKEKELAERLAAYKDSLSEEELAGIEQDSTALVLYQEMPDSEEVLNKIPKLKREDLKKDAIPFTIAESEDDGLKFIHHDIFTNGISYVALDFDITDIDKEYLPYLGFFAEVIGAVDTENYSYENFGYEADKITGSLITTPLVISDAYDIDKYRIFFEVSTKYFDNAAGDVFELIKEMLTKSKYDDSKRIKEILLEKKSRKQNRIISAGHVAAMRRNLAHINEVDAVEDEISGMAYYEFLCKAQKAFENDDEKAKAEFVGKMKELAEYIFDKSRLLTDVVGSKEALENVKNIIRGFKETLPNRGVKTNGKRPGVVKVNEAYKTPSQVNYVCKSGSYRGSGLRYSGKFKVLKTILGYEYLWNEVRVKGGAYGCMNKFDNYGNISFVSYRDPNMLRTIEVFDNAAKFVSEFSADEDTMTKHIIGTMSEMDVPLTPYRKGLRSYVAYLRGLKFETVQQERDDVLTATDEDIRALAKHISKAFEDGCICMVGTETDIDSNVDKFEVIKNI